MSFHPLRVSSSLDLPMAARCEHARNWLHDEAALTESAPWVISRSPFGIAAAPGFSKPRRPWLDCPFLYYPRRHLLHPLVMEPVGKEKEPQRG